MDCSLPGFSVHGIFQARVLEIKTKINKWGLVKLKSFCTAKVTINNVKRQLLEWEKITASETTEKGLISKTYKQHTQLCM